MDKALKKLNEEKNTINCDIDMIRHSTVTLLMMMIINDNYHDGFDLVGI